MPVCFLEFPIHFDPSCGGQLSDPWGEGGPAHRLGIWAGGKKVRKGAAGCEPRAKKSKLQKYPKIADYGKIRFLGQNVPWRAPFRPILAFESQSVPKVGWIPRMGEVPGLETGCWLAGPALWLKRRPGRSSKKATLPLREEMRGWLQRPQAISPPPK